VLSPDGQRWYYLDMGWEDLRLAAEYDGDHHRSDPDVFAYDIHRLDDLRVLGWTHIRVAARNRTDEVLARMRRAWDPCSR
jgi:very-short-patch-repair endonuclease